MNSMARKISRSMVSGTGIAEIANRTLPQAVSLDHTLLFGVTSYETGMIEVLRGIAEEDFEYGVGSITVSAETKKRQKITVEKYEMIEKALTEADHELFRDYEDAFQDSANADAGDHFIEGFIRGYRYLKNQMEFRGGVSR